MALVELSTIIKAIQDVARGLTGMRAAPPYPPESPADFPFAVTYPDSGTSDLHSGNFITNLPEVVTEIHLSALDLAATAERAYPYLELFGKAIMDDIYLSSALTAGEGGVRSPIRYEFGYLSYFGHPTVGWRFFIPIKTQGTTT
jgi:hypothetical protein